ncbi:hypothetical protein [Microbacterium sp. 77mftsu3.1]|uniref:hypothetical protein n=1 Tax=Microbacterium sp. 77mftsu3.1 TaxID=1761802 RepID=UPI00035CB81D|nr:hypothetical protein [Microbacterium sp. 77mftsu3.1]SDH55044.1 hypothetical protein SAMN04488590_3549 [Microbacterium sp. 77mftsu3.1]
MTTSTFLENVTATFHARSDAFARLTDTGGQDAYRLAHRAADNAILEALHRGATPAAVSAAAGIPEERLPKALRRMASAGSKLAIELVRRLYPITSVAA